MCSLGETGEKGEFHNLRTGALKDLAPTVYNIDVSRSFSMYIKEFLVSSPITEDFRSFSISINIEISTILLYF